MTLPVSGSYNQIDVQPERVEMAHPLGLGLPSMWWPSVCGLASLVFGAFWMAESWRTAKPLLGPAKVNHLTQDLWGLILILGSGYALYQFYKRRSETLGIVLCLLLAAAAMTWHRL